MLYKIFRITLLALLLALSACSTPPQEEDTGEFFDSSLITAKVKMKLFDDPLTGGFHIKVNTSKGVVQLSGFVNTAEAKQRAEMIASSIDGVKKVENTLLVTPLD